MSDELTYTVEEANAELSDLRDRLARVKESRQAILAASRRIREAVEADGGGQAGGDYWGALAALKAEIEHFAERNILLRDAETGLVDFPAERDGEVVYLCWRLGEERVAWWHPLDTGFVGRRPL
jgi:hypothetical protein